MLDYHRAKEFQIRQCRVIMNGHDTEYMLATDVESTITDDQATALEYIFQRTASLYGIDFLRKWLFEPNKYLMGNRPARIIRESIIDNHMLGILAVKKLCQKPSKEEMS